MHAHFYDLLLAPFERLAIGKWRRSLWQRVTGRRILEVGVGTGRNIPYYPQGIKVTAIDRHAGFLARAHRRKARLGHPVVLKWGDVHRLPFDDEVFDCVVASFLFCSVEYPNVGMREILRVLRPGGRFIVLEHGRASGLLGRFMDILARPLYRLTGDHIGRDATQLARAVGFRRLEVEPVWLDVIKIIRGEKPGVGGFEDNR